MILKSYALGLIGYPLGHSLSPQIHGVAMHAVGISGEYSLHPIPPLPEGEKELEALLDRVKDGGIQGLNVTIPHKQNVIPLLDELTPAASTIGAVNTIFLEEDKLVGDNTDAPGFWKDLRRIMRKQELGAQHALILGAGGSARAVVYALLTHGYQVNIAARRPEQARELCHQLSTASNQSSQTNGPPVAIELTPSAIAALRSPISLIVNTTPVGMYPNENASPWPDEIQLPENAVVYDLVYNPRETLLVRYARDNGLAASTGLGMLIEQAALAFERWTGFEAPRAEMMAAFKFK